MLYRMLELEGTSFEALLAAGQHLGRRGLGDVPLAPESAAAVSRIREALRDNLPADAARELCVALLMEEDRIT